LFVNRPQKPEPSLDERKRLTFEQAEGAEPLPSQLKPKEISPRLRARLWLEIYGFLKEGYYYNPDGADQILEPWESIFYSMHVDRDHKPADEFDNDFDTLVDDAKNKIFHGNYVEVFGWIQHVLRSNAPNGFAGRIQAALQEGKAAYRVVGGNTIAPIGSEAESETIVRAFGDLRAREFRGAQQHLRNAAEKLTSSDNASSIRESIHAVESVVRVLEPKGDFAKALAKLDAKIGIHGALKAGFGSLYGYTSDENGLRHALLDAEAAKVDDTDALFMIGACAAFVSYLINKSRAAGLL
jgi:hypothetical protein